MPDVVFHTRYGADGASSRTRAFDLVEPLAAHGVEAVVVPRPRFEEVLAEAASGAAVVLQKPGLTFAQLEALRATRAPLVVDFDDAIWMGYGGGEPVDGPASLTATLRAAEAVTTGSEHLAAWARSATDAPVHVLRPAVDPSRYAPRRHAETERPLLVWIGSAGTLHDLDAVDGALRPLLAAGRIRLRVVADEPWRGGGELAPWSLEHEARLLAEADIGVMPLAESERARGRCGFKAVQYQAAGLPVVASPAGGPAEAVGAGLFARTAAEWREAILTLAASAGLRADLGAAGRAHVEAHHSLAGNARRLAAILGSLR